MTALHEIMPRMLERIRNGEQYCVCCTDQGVFLWFLHASALFVASEGTAGSPRRGLRDRLGFIDRGSE
jgi:hypothetical protein